MIDSFLGVAPRGQSGWVNKGPTDDYWYEPRGIETVAGVDIDEDAALQISTVFACVAKVSKTVATLPIDVVEKTGPNTRQPVDHPLAELLEEAANEDATGLTTREAGQANLEMWGGQYYLIDWDGRGREPRRLTLLPSRYITRVIRDDDGELVYIYNEPTSGQEPIPASRIWHVPGFSLNGVTGLSTVGYNRELCGFSKAVNQFGAAFFGNGAWAGGFVERPMEAPELSPTAASQWLASLNEKFRGPSKAFGFALLREGMQFKQIEMPFEDAMFLGTRKHNRVEIAGWFDVPLIMIQDDEHSTFRNSEQADIAFAKHSILPRLLRLEMSARKRFFPGTKLRLKHNLAGLVRADFKTMMEGFSVGRQWGIYSINDCRALLDMNPIEGGNTYLQPLNMQPVGGATQLPAPMPNGGDDDGEDGEGNSEGGDQDGRKRTEVLAMLRPAIEHAAEELAKRQCRAVQNAFSRLAKGGTWEDFQSWAKKFFEDQHAKVMESKLLPIAEGWQRATGEDVRERMWLEICNWCGECQERVLVCMHPPERLEPLLSDWKANLASGLTEHMTVVWSLKDK